MNEKFRCFGNGIPIYEDYHDNEWGKPMHDDIKLFEMLSLAGAQAGLSWLTILKRRDAYREAFDGFDPHKIVKYDDAKLEELMTNAGIIRNRLKILSVVQNAKAFLDVVKTHGSFDKFLWQYVNFKPIIGNWEKITDIPASTPLSDLLSRDLKKLGFKFVGSTIVYAYMQSIGMINDHVCRCCTKR